MHKDDRNKIANPTINTSDTKPTVRQWIGQWIFYTISFSIQIPRVFPFDKSIVLFDRKYATLGIERGCMQIVRNIKDSLGIHENSR